jgi:hypothetical protein
VITKAVQVNFRPQMESPRAFHRQLMQPERVPHLTELRRRRLKQAQPYETALAAAGRRILQRYRARGCTSRRLAVDAWGGSDTTARSGNFYDSERPVIRRSAPASSADAGSSSMSDMDADDAARSDHCGHA